MHMDGDLVVKLPADRADALVEAGGTGWRSARGGCASGCGSRPARTGPCSRARRSPTPGADGARQLGRELHLRAARVHAPASLDELRRLLAPRPRIRVLGTRHTFTAMGDSDELVRLDRLPAEIEADPAEGTVSCGGATTYGALATELDRHGLALDNLASLPHIGVAGAIATATHGSGDAHGNLATAVTALELVTSAGDAAALRRGDDGFAGAVVHLGALGRGDPGDAGRARRRARPPARVRGAGLGGARRAPRRDLRERRQRQRVHALGRRGRPGLGQAARGEDVAPAELFGARAATVERHPIIELDPVNCTAQLGRPGPWWDRLPHFRMGFTPSAGEELQSEYFVARADARAAIGAVRELRPRIAPVLLVTELRTIAPDDLWMSPHHGRPLGIHFTWRRDPAGVAEALPALEAALAPLGARPHWGKVFAAAAAPAGHRADDFLALAAALDPRGAFRNDWFEAAVSG